MTKKGHSCPECDKKKKEIAKYAKLLEENIECDDNE